MVKRPAWNCPVLSGIHTILGKVLSGILFLANFHVLPVWRR
jgi:hypothetical protein